MNEVRGGGLDFYKLEAETGNMLVKSRVSIFPPFKISPPPRSYVCMYVFLGLYSLTWEKIVHSNHTLTECDLPEIRNIDNFYFDTENSKLNIENIDFKEMFC